MNNFDSVKQMDLLSILLPSVHIYVLKLLWRKHFFEIIFRQSHNY